MKFIDAIGLKYFYDKLKDKFVQRITYNKKTSVDDIKHTDIERAIEAPLIIGSKKNSTSTDNSLVLQDGNSSFEDGTGNYIKIGGENIDINSDNIHLCNDTLIINDSGNSYKKYNVDVDSYKISLHTGQFVLELDTETDMQIHPDDGFGFRTSYGYSFRTFYKPSLPTMTFNELGGRNYKGEFTDGTDDGLKISYYSDAKNTQEICYKFNSTETRLLKDVITASKTQIRNRLSSTCSTKLTEAKGFQVFTNLYADPEHCTDITDYTDTEKAILTNNTVQKNILELNKTKTFVDGIKESDTSISFKATTINGNIIYTNKNIVSSTGITLQRVIPSVNGDTVSTKLSIKESGITIAGGKATQVFAANGSLFDISSKAEAFTEIASSKWSTDTPFIINNTTITNIYKGETVGKFTKWILFVYEDSEDQTYTATKTTNSNFLYGKYNYQMNVQVQPWELWLPSNLTTGSVTVDW